MCFFCSHMMVWCLKLEAKIKNSMRTRKANKCPKLDQLTSCAVFIRLSIFILEKIRISYKTLQMSTKNAVLAARMVLGGFTQYIQSPFSNMIVQTDWQTYRKTVVRTLGWTGRRTKHVRRRGIANDTYWFYLSLFNCKTICNCLSSGQIMINHQFGT